MITRILTALAVLAALAGIYLLSREPGVGGVPQPAGTPPEEQGYAARNAELIETGDDGRPIYRLLADLVRQRPSDSRVELEAPRMTFTASDGNTWHVTANSGEILADGSNVDLFGDVHVRGQLPGASAPAIIETSVLSFDTRAEVVTSHAPVSLDWNGRKLSGTGLIAKLPDHQVKLESRIHGSFPAQ